MTKIEARLFLYCCRLINGFEGRESKVVSIIKIAESIGASRKQVGRALENLSRSTNVDGSFRQTFLSKKDRGIKRAFEIRIVFPGCMPSDIKGISPDVIESRMFLVPAAFFDGYKDRVGDTTVPLKDWSLIDVQLFFRICAIHNQKEFGEVSLRNVCQLPLRLKTAILPAINLRTSRVSPSLLRMQKLEMVTILDRNQKDDYLFKVTRPESRDYSQTDPESTYIETQTSHGRQNMPHVEPKMSHGRPEMSHVEPKMSHGKGCSLSPEMSHVKPEMSHVKPEMSHVKPEMSHVKPRMSHVKPRMSHYESVVVVSLRDTTTEPTKTSEGFILKIAETDDEIPCSLTEAINFAIESTSQVIEDPGRYAGGLRKKAANGIVIKGDGSTYFDIATYARKKINELMSQKSGEIRCALNAIIKAGRIPLVTMKSGKKRYVQKITEDIVVLTLDANQDSSSRKSFYGNDVPLFLLEIIDISEGEVARPASTVDQIKTAISEGKQVDLFSKKKPRINIVDFVGNILISVTDGEKGELKEDDLIKLQKPVSFKGPGYKIRFNGCFLGT